MIEVILVLILFIAVIVYIALYAKLIFVCSGETSKTQKVKGSLLSDDNMYKMAEYFHRTGEEEIIYKVFVYKRFKDKPDKKELKGTEYGSWSDTPPIGYYIMYTSHATFKHHRSGKIELIEDWSDPVDTKILIDENT